MPGFLGPLFDRAPRAQSPENPTYPLTSQVLIDLFAGPKAHAGVYVTERKALHMPAVWRSVNLISETCASLPLNAFKRGDETRKILTTGQAAALLDEPHPDLTPMELWSLMFTHGLLWGNAYFRKLYDRMGRLAELWPIEPDRVQAGRTSETGTKVYAIDGGEPGGGYDFTDKEILHFPAFGYDGICGVSPIRMAREGIGLGLAAEEYASRLFGNGSLASGVLQTEQRLTKDQADRLHARWRAKQQGLQNAHEAVVLDSGVKFHQLTIPPEDAQFLQSREFQVEEIARMFGIPPHMLASMKSSTSWGTGLEQQVIAFVVFTLRPWLTRYEQRITRLLKPEPVYAKFAVQALLRGDSQARSDFYTKLWMLGALSTNDIRALEDAGPVQGGDVRYRPLNMGILGESDTQPAPTPPGTDTGSDQARAIAAAIQNGYLGVDTVVTPEQLRDILKETEADNATVS